MIRALFKERFSVAHLLCCIPLLALFYREMFFQAVVLWVVLGVFIGFVHKK